MNENIKLFWLKHKMRIFVLIVLAILLACAFGWGWVLQWAKLTQQLEDQLTIVAFAIFTARLIEFVARNLCFQKAKK